MKVLVADDSLVMRRLLESSLAGWDYHVLSAKDGADAWSYLQAEDAPALAVLDWMMPVHSGLDLCRMVRALNRPRYIYIILLTSRGLREDIVEGLSAGADDYVVKPFDKHELEVRLRAGRRIIDLQAELMRTQEALREQAMKDALTGVWNRGSIIEILEHEVARSVRDGAPLGVLMMDLDHFKQVNDTYGHQAGDEALRTFAARVSAAKRSYDYFGRYGGEEFMLVAPGCDEQFLTTQAERIRRAIDDEPFQIGSTTVHITASFGACALDRHFQGSAAHLVRAADAALYAAKHAGRNAVVYNAPASVQRLD